MTVVYRLAYVPAISRSIVTYNMGIYFLNASFESGQHPYMSGDKTGTNYFDPEMVDQKDK